MPVSEFCSGHKYLEVLKRCIGNRTSVREHCAELVASALYLRSREPDDIACQYRGRRLSQRASLDVLAKGRDPAFFQRNIDGDGGTAQG